MTSFNLSRRAGRLRARALAAGLAFLATSAASAAPAAPAALSRPARPDAATDLTAHTATRPAAQTAPRPAPVAKPAEQLHALAMHSFRQGRFPEAYGRFVALADAGHAPAARQALWMCEHGLAHFGHNWDCAPHQVADWRAAAGIADPGLPSAHGAALRPAAGPQRRR